MSNINPSQKRSDLISSLIILANLIFVLAPVFLSAALPLGWYDIFFWIWFGITANSLTLLLHELSHLLAFRNKNWSAILGIWFLGPLLFTDFRIYQARHWIHHKLLGDVQDTKKTYLCSIDGKNGLYLLVRILFLSGAFTAMARQIFQLKNYSDLKDVENKIPEFHLIPLVIFQLLFSTAIFFLSYSGDKSILNNILHWLVSYVFIYLYGLASLTVLMAHVRAIAEHGQGISESGRKVGLCTLRTMKVNLITRFLFGSYGFADHAAHHLYPGYPSYLLPAVTKKLALNNPELAPEFGYLELIYMGFLNKK